MIQATVSDIGFRPLPPHRASGARHRIVASFAIAAALCVALPVAAQEKTSASQDSGLEWDGVSLRDGENFRLEPHIRFQTDVTLRDDSEPLDDDRVDWQRRRIGVEGLLFKRVGFQVEGELGAEQPWRDVYGDVKVAAGVRIRAGRFKVPFSMEQTTSGFDLDFLERATVVTALSPGRNVGVMVHGRSDKHLIKYEAGIFNRDIDSRLPVPPSAWGMLAGRVTVSPVHDNNKHFTRDLEFGAGVVRNQTPDGLNGVNGRTLSGDRFFDQLYVNGQRLRLGVDGLWNAGRLTVKGELLQLTDQRKGQAVDGGDLSDLVVHGNYVTGIWRVIGKHGNKGMAVDAAVRFDHLAFGSRNQADEAFTNPRADHLAPLSKDALTGGTTVIINRWIKVQGNIIREQFVDPLQVRDLVPGALWTSELRLQFGL